MPRVSSAPEDAYHFKGSYQDGWGKITDAKPLVFQYPPTKEAKNNRAAGHQDPPQLVAELTIQRYSDGDGTKSPTPPEQVLLSIQKPDKQTGELTACHPGKFPDGNLEEEPEDMGGDLGAEGDTLFALQDGYQLNDKCKWMTFTTSLVEKGFKPAVLKRTYFPDLIGLYAYFTTVVKPKQASDDFDSTVFVVKEIKEFPYEKTNAKPAAKGAAAKPPAATKGAAAKTPTPGAAKAKAAEAEKVAASNGDLSAEDIAAALVTQTLATSQQGALLPDMTKVKVMAYLAINKHKPTVPTDLKKDVQAQLSDLDWLQATGEANSVFEVLEDGSVQFA